jgi:hypothetical protein
MAAAKKKPWKIGAINGHITDLKQSICETFDIYGTRHIHLNNIDCLTACTTCLVGFTSTVNGHSKKRSLGRLALLMGTNLKQSISKTFDIYGTRHRHLSNIDCSTTCTACLVCFISTANGCIKKEALESRH